MDGGRKLTDSAQRGKAVLQVFAVERVGELENALFACACFRLHRSPKTIDASDFFIRVNPLLENAVCIRCSTSHDQTAVFHHRSCSTADTNFMQKKTTISITL